MEGSRSGVQTRFVQLLSVRGLNRPDGRALYSYRFTREEYGIIRNDLERYRLFALNNPFGAALFVAFAAEWFRRDREGGHWDWIRPLGEIGIRYAANDRRADVQYSDIREAVKCGLRIWGRPLPADGSWIYAIVSEAGFPAATIRDHPRIASWLRKSVLLVERGIEARDAVMSEAWRVASDNLVRVMIDASVELCGVVAQLRRLLPSDGQRIDSIAFLDGHRPNWRNDLPFEVEEEDVKALVENMLRSTSDRSDALLVTRSLRRSGHSWAPHLAIQLTGVIENVRLPGGLRHRLHNESRIRLVPRGVLADLLSRPIAALERVEEEDTPVWELRPLISKFDVALGFDDEVMLGARLGDRIVDEFLAFGGESLAGTVVVLEPKSLGPPDQVNELTVLGISSVRSKQPWLALAADPRDIERIVFEPASIELGACKRSGRRVLAFTGIAKMEIDGQRLIWQANAEREESLRLVLAGEMARGLSDQAFLGLPRAWLNIDGIYHEKRSRDLSWRPKGRGQWRSLSNENPLGEIDIAVRHNGEISAWSRALVLPRGFAVRGEPKTRRLVVEGAEGASIAASAPNPLPIKRGTDSATIDMTSVEPGRIVELKLIWEATADIRVSDPTLERALIKPAGHCARARARSSVNRLHGYRLFASNASSVSFELSELNEGRTVGFSRVVDGDAPLVGYVDDIRDLLGSTGNLDAQVRLAWLGESDRAAEVGWYDIDPGSYVSADTGPFSRSKLTMLGIEQVQACSLATPRRTETFAGKSFEIDPVGNLENSLGPGPWLLFGRDLRGNVLRPRVVSEEKPSTGPAETETELWKAVRIRDQRIREEQLSLKLKAPAGLQADDFRLVIDTALAARAFALPMCTFDVLCALSRAGSAAVWTLAMCETLDERSAVLNLQREFPFLWCVSSVNDWTGGFLRGARAASPCRRAG
jgi:hypothetical protein